MEASGVVVDRTPFYDHYFSVLIKAKRREFRDNFFICIWLKAQQVMYLCIREGLTVPMKNMMVILIVRMFNVGAGGLVSLKRDT